jgi:hypothetical protein
LLSLSDDKSRVNAAPGGDWNFPELHEESFQGDFQLEAYVFSRER